MSEVPIPVVILCGGQGTRLAEQTEVRPKPLVEIGGRPILWHIMKHYAQHGLTEFVLALGHKGDQIKRYFRDKGWSLRVPRPDSSTIARYAGASPRRFPRSAGSTMSPAA